MLPGRSFDHRSLHNVESFIGEGLRISLTSAFELGAVAMIIGFFVGATGIGGFLIIPAMVAIGGLPLQVAIGTALATGVSNGALGAFLYRRRGSVDKTLAIPLALGGACFGLVGGSISPLLSPVIVASILGVVMLLGSGFALRKSGTDPSSPTSSPRTGSRFVLLTGIGALSGLVGGVTGAGGPLVSVPLLTILSYSVPLTVGASQYLQLVASTSGIIPYWRAGDISLVALGLIVPLQLLGVWFGVRATHSMELAVARKVVAGLGFAVGAGILYYVAIGGQMLQR